jgi:hypothetical protein
MKLTLRGGPHDGLIVHKDDLPPGYVQGIDDVGTLTMAFFVGEDELSRPCRECGHYGAEHGWIFSPRGDLADFMPGGCTKCGCPMFRDPAARRIDPSD